jgi:recombination protein RecA
MAATISREDLLKRMYAELDKKHGKGVGRPISEAAYEPLPRYSTTLLGVDRILGGGIPRGRITEIYGQPSSGKSSLALLIAAQCQREGGRAAYIDAEQTFDKSWARRLGADPESINFAQPECGEDALDILHTFIKSEAIDLVIVDSVAAMVPRVEAEGEIGKSYMGLHARLMSQGLRIINPAVSRTSCAVVFLNQIRMKMTEYGSPETTPGGEALKFFASTRIELRGTAPIKHGEVRIGQYIKVKVPKNKTYMPKGEAEVPFVYEIGFDRLRELVDLGVKADLVTRSGAWYSYGDARMGQGIEAAIEFLADHPDAATELRTKLLALLTPDPEVL